MDKAAIRRRLYSIFTRERTICRLVAAWCCFVLTTLRPTSYYYAHISFAQNIGLGRVALFTLGFFILLTVLAFFAVPLHTDAIGLFAASTFCMLFWCYFSVDEGSDWFLLAATLVYALFVIYCVRALTPLLESWQPSKKTQIGFAIAAGVICSTVIAVFGCLRYLSFAAPNFDFGIWCHMFRNMRETGEAITTCERDMLLSHFAVHISPIYYTLLPFYYIFPSPLTLQIAQAVVLGAGVVPIFLLARHFKLSPKSTVLVTLLYAFYPAITMGCSFDLHENCFLPLLLLFTFYFYETKRPIPMYLFAALVLMVKEDAAIYLLFFALFLLLGEKKYLHGSILAAMAIGYFVLCGYLLEAHGTGMMVNRFDNLIYNEEDGLLGVVKTALVNPGYLLTQLFAHKDDPLDKVIYLCQMFLPLGLLPFCSKKTSRWLLVAPILINLLSMYVYQAQIGFQYHFGITAFLFYATLKNLPELAPGELRRNLLSVAAAACLCGYAMTALPFMGGYVSRWHANKDSFAQMESFLEETIPEDASVAASTYLVPHLTERDEIYEVFYHGNKTDIDYVVLDTRYASHEEFLKSYTYRGYEIVAELEGRICVLKRPTEN